ISPNGDGQADTALLEYRLSTPANVTVAIVDPNAVTVATVVDRVWTRAGEHSVDVDAAALPDGIYSIVLTARTAAGSEVQKTVPITVSRTLGLVTVSPALFSPNDDGRLDELEIGFALAAQADVRVRILRDGRWVASPLVASYPPGLQRFVWNGIRSSGRLRDGMYEAVIEARDAIGTISVAVPFASDTTPPRVRILRGRPLRIQLSEPAALTLRIDGAIRRREARNAGIVRIPWRGRAARVRVVAVDAAGNSSAPIVRVTRTRPSAPGQ
ncbi:MAG: hypothetical protein ACRDNY_06385, partial [Gaiellaceae bacterium]